jgi:DNA-nicking Smr family endonuclease
LEISMKKRDEDPDSVDADFVRAMAAENVVPLSRDSPERAGGTPPVDLRPMPKPPVAPDVESDGVAEPGADFAARGIDRREIRKLKRGEYVPAARFDLHGMTADAASDGVRRFLEASRRNRRRCVCIAHGRGLRSPGGVAVLKARVREYLRSHPAVLAYADAPRSDGGPGAVYVLLRRQA